MDFITSIISVFGSIYGIYCTFVIILTAVFIKLVQFGDPIARPVPLKRQICDQNMEYTELQYIHPLLWSTEPIVKYPDVLPRLPENLKDKCYTAHSHFNEAKLAACLESAFNDTGLSYTREDAVYRWDVRLPSSYSRLVIIIEVRIFREESGELTVYFNKHYGYDSMIAYDLIDRIARNALDIVVSNNPLRKVHDDW